MREEFSLQVFIKRWLKSMHHIWSFLSETTENNPVKTNV